MIFDKRVYVGKTSLLGHGDDYTANKAKPELLTKGISVVGKHAHLPEGTIVGRNVRIFGYVTLNDENKFVNSGETIEK